MPQRWKSPPSLILPSWAIDHSILDRIEALVLAVQHEVGPSPSGKDARVLNSIDTMRTYIESGTYTSPYLDPDTGEDCQCP